MYKDKTALVERTPSLKTKKSITWEEFYRTSNRVANALDKEGIQKGDKIVQMNYNAVDRGGDVTKIEVPSEWKDIKVNGELDEKEESKKSKHNYGNRNIKTSFVRDILVDRTI